MQVVFVILELTAQNYNSATAILRNLHSLERR
jgi:hypothetical protein